MKTTTSFFGRQVSLSTIEIRQNAQKAAEQNKISPRDYYAILKNTWPRMTPGEKRAEIESLS